MSSRYRLVCSPIQVGSCEIKNRIVRTAHGTGYADGNVTERLIAFHEARARGGVGLIFTETAGVHPTSPASFTAYRDAIIPGWARLADRLRPHGTRIFAQLHHYGMHATPEDGGPAWAPSPIRDPLRGRTAIEMTAEMIGEVAEGFAAAAARAQRAGLDGVEVHAAHGYLLGAFLSPLTNAREDDYGGTLENRARFLRQVLAAIRNRVSVGFPVGVRLSATEAAEGGLEPPEVRTVAQGLEIEELIDFLDISQGSYFAEDKMIGAMHEPHGYQLPTSEKVTRAVALPTIVTGRVLTLAEAERVVESNIADLVSMVRATLADPDLVIKSLAGDEARVRPCIGCNEGCIGSRKTTGVVGCSVNVYAGRETIAPPPSAPERRSILVVGAGPAGLEAAFAAARRGHRVTICDAAAAPGGLVGVARRAPHRWELGNICDWLWRELDELGVDRRLSCAIDATAVEREAPDAVIIATGSTARRDAQQRLRPSRAVSGVDQSHVITVVEALNEMTPTGTSALVFDDLGTYVAIGAAERLLDAGLDVTFVTSFGMFAPALVPTFQHRPVAARLLGNPRFHVITAAALVEIEPVSATVEDLNSGTTASLTCDLVVLATGFVPTNALYPALKREGFEVHVAGDAVGPLGLQAAIASGHAAGARV